LYLRNYVPPAARRLDRRRLGGVSVKEVERLFGKVKLERRVWSRNFSAWRDSRRNFSEPLKIFFKTDRRMKDGLLRCNLVSRTLLFRVAGC